MATAIEINNISKQYALGTIGTGTISKDLNRWWARIRGKEDPYLKIGETNDRLLKAKSGFVWALKDIDFKVEQGEVLGIIGKNGAGKSTLLKILSRVTTPTTGFIRAKGRIASLLEVGTGFHPEMTGRENIYMNGAIMGMTRQEITRKLDDIVNFAGVEKYIDTPVKRYSSGMTVRLGFAIASHLEPEILVVDEVLAVGDAEFQKKAIGKMQDVSKGEGRTVLFVSHNMAAVRSLCNTGIVLQNGLIGFQGNIKDCMDFYLNDNPLLSDAKIIDRIKNCKSTLQIKKISINNTENANSTVQSHQKKLEVEISGYTDEDMLTDVMIIFKSKEGMPLCSYAVGHYKGIIEKIAKGTFTLKRTIELPKFLSRGVIYIDLMLHHPTVEYQLQAPNCCSLELEGYQSSYGVSLVMDTNGFIGLDDYEK